MATFCIMEFFLLNHGRMKENISIERRSKPLWHYGIPSCWLVHRNPYAVMVFYIAHITESYHLLCTATHHGPLVTAQLKTGKVMQFTFSPTSRNLFAPWACSQNKTNRRTWHHQQKTTESKQIRFEQPVDTRLLPFYQPPEVSRLRVSFCNLCPQKIHQNGRVKQKSKNIQTYFLFNKDPPFFTEICWRILTMRIITLWGTSGMLVATCLHGDSGTLFDTNADSQPRQRNTKTTSHFTVLQKSWYLKSWAPWIDLFESIWLLHLHWIKSYRLLRIPSLLAEASFFLSTFLRMPVRARTTNMTMKQSNHLKTYLLLKKRDFPLPMLVFRSVPPVLIDFPFRTWWFVGNVFEWTASHWKSRISVKSDFCFICWFLWHFLSLMELGSLSIFITKLPTMKQRGSIYESQESTQPHRYPDILTRPFFSSPFSPAVFCWDMSKTLWGFHKTQNNVAKYVNIAHSSIGKHGIETLLVHINQQQSKHTWIK